MKTTHRLLLAILYTQFGLHLIAADTGVAWKDFFGYCWGVLMLTLSIIQVFKAYKNQAL